MSKLHKRLQARADRARKIEDYEDITVRYIDSAGQETTAHLRCQERTAKDLIALGTEAQYLRNLLTGRQPPEDTLELLAKQPRVLWTTFVAPSCGLYRFETIESQDAIAWAQQASDLGTLIVDCDGPALELYTQLLDLQPADEEQAGPQMLPEGLPIGGEALFWGKMCGQPELRKAIRVR